MGADFFFRQGESHAICQDYAIAGAANGVEYAILSDGCSGRPNGEPGAPFTDFGARILTRACRQLIGSNGDPYMLGERILDHAVPALRLLNLPSMALDATLLWAVADEHQVVIRRAGDGVTVKKYRDGTVRATWWEFGRNMPFYLTNLLSSERCTQYCRSAKTVTRHEALRSAAGEWTTHDAIEEELGPEHAVAESVHNRSDLDFVMLLSDGAETFYSKDDGSVSVQRVIDELLAFKSYDGEFMKRRCKVLLASREWKHDDDFSVAALYVGDAR